MGSAAEEGLETVMWTAVIGVGFVAPVLLVIAGSVLTRRLIAKGRGGRAASVVGCGVVILTSLLVVATYVPWWYLLSAGMQVEVENSSTEVVALWANEDESSRYDQRASFPIQPGESVRLWPVAGFGSKDVACLTDQPGALARSSNTGLLIDPDTDGPIVLVDLPAPHCFEGVQARLDWSGSDLIVRGPDRPWAAILLPAAAGGLCLVLLAIGSLRDRRR